MGTHQQTDLAIEHIDQRNLDWYIDKAVEILVFICGISAIIFIIGIFTFITKEGYHFVLQMDWSEFFLTQYWFPSDEDAPEFGILALIAGTASVTGLAMLVALLSNLTLLPALLMSVKPKLRAGPTTNMAE